MIINVSPPFHEHVFIIMIATRRKLCLVYLGPTVCLLGLIYTIFYTEYRLPRILKRMQQNLVLNDQVYYQNQTNGEKISPSIFGGYDSNEELASPHFKRLSDHDAIDDIPKNEDIESILEEEATQSLEECQIWIPIKDKVYFESLKKSRVITDKTFLSICSIESAIKSARSDEDTKNRVCLLVDRFDKSLSFNLENQSNALGLDSERNRLFNIKKEGWFKALKKRYNSEEHKLTLIIPDYATVFSGIDQH